MKKIIFLMFLTSLTVYQYGQTPGSLDVSFDTDGKVTTDFGGANDDVNSVVVQSDGKIVVAGYTDNGSIFEIVLCRYNVDGSLDLTFDGDGKVVTNFGTSFAGGNSLAIQTDGKIVLSGTAHNGTDLDLALLRYNTDGSLDNTFDGDGKLTMDFVGADDYGNVIILQPDGKIVMAGASILSYAVMFLNRFNTDGSLDTTFGTSGTALMDLGGPDASPLSIVLQTDGKIVVAGFTGTMLTNDVLVARYNSDGSLDNTFDGDGMAITDFAGANDYGKSICVQSDGKLVVGGSSDNGSLFDFAVLRYNTNGSLDNTFDSDGKLITDFSSGSIDVCNSVICLPNNKILASGFSGAPGDFAMALYNSDGTLNPIFGTGGKVITDFGGFVDIGHSACLQADGKIVLAGYSNNGTDTDFGLARYAFSLNVGLSDFPLLQNSVYIYPNPIEDFIVVSYDLSNSETISITLNDMNGKLIKTFLQNQKQESGHYSQFFDLPDGIPSGTYFITIATSEKNTSVKLIK